MFHYQFMRTVFLFILFLNDVDGGDAHRKKMMKHVLRMMAAKDHALNQHQRFTTFSSRDTIDGTNSGKVNPHLGLNVVMAPVVEEMAPSKVVSTSLGKEFERSNDKTTQSSLNNQQALYNNNNLDNNYNNYNNNNENYNNYDANNYYNNNDGYSNFYSNSNNYGNNANYDNLNNNANYNYDDYLRGNPYDYNYKADYERESVAPVNYRPGMFSRMNNYVSYLFSDPGSVLVTSAALSLSLLVLNLVLVAMNRTRSGKRRKRELEFEEGGVYSLNELLDVLMNEIKSFGGNDESLKLGEMCEQRVKCELKRLMIRNFSQVDINKVKSGVTRNGFNQCKYLSCANWVHALLTPFLATGRTKSIIDSYFDVT